MRLQRYIHNNAGMAPYQSGPYILAGDLIALIDSLDDVHRCDYQEKWRKLSDMVNDDDIEFNPG